MPSISFVCPLYNKRRYLPSVLAALKKQATNHERQFIFVDDGSTDGSLDLVKFITRHWPDCLYIRQKNSGPADAINTGIASATGDYLKLLGADDILSPFSTDLLLESLDSTAAVAAYGRQAYYQDLSEAVFAKPDQHSWNLVENPLETVIRLTLAGTSQTLFRTAAVRAAGGYDPRIFAGNFSLSLRLALLGPFTLHDAVTAFGPADESARFMAARKHQVLHDNNLALALFFKDHPRLKKQYGAQALRQCAIRAERWVCREGDGESALRYKIMRIASRLPAFDHAGLIATTLPAFSAGQKARITGIIHPSDHHTPDEISQSPRVVKI